MNENQINQLNPLNINTTEIPTIKIEIRKTTSYWKEEIGEIIKNCNTIESINKTSFSSLIQQRLPSLSRHTIDPLVQIVAQALKGKEPLLEKKVYEDIAKNLNIQTFLHISRENLERILNQYPLSLKIELAKIAAQTDGNDLSYNIHFYKINPNDPEGLATLIEIAKIAANNSTKDGIAHLINNYGINPNTSNGIAALIEIAKIEAQRNGTSVSRFIANYGIDPEKHQADLIEIAKLAAAQNGSGTSQWIKNYKIDPTTPEGQKALIEIAEIAAQSHGGGTSLFIKNYEIDDKTPEGKEALIRIAQLAAQQNGGRTSQYIQNYGFDPKTAEGQKILIEIAFIVAKHHGKKISKHIQNYQIEDRHVRIEIAKIAVRQHGGKVSQYIQNYGIDPNTSEGQKTLIEIAEMAAEQENIETSKFGGRVSKYIENYQIDPSTAQGQISLIRIAKIAARNTAKKTSEYIKRYQINYKTPEGQKALIEIAKIAAKEIGGIISQHIENYLIDHETPEGQAALIEIANISVFKLGTNTLAHLDKYKINKKSEEGQTAIIEIAKHVAKREGETVSEFIQACDIDPKLPENQLALIEIAKTAAAKSGRNISKYIHNYAINPNNQAALIEIAKISARQNGAETLQNIKNFGIDSNTPEGEAGLNDIYKIALRQGGWEIYKSNKREGSIPVRKEDSIPVVLYAISSFLESILRYNELPIKETSLSQLFGSTICEPIANIFLQKNLKDQLEAITQEVELISQQLYPSNTEFTHDNEISHLLQSIINLKMPPKMTLTDHRHIQFQQLIFLMKAIADLSMYGVDQKTLKSICIPIIEMELRLRDPEVRRQTWEFFITDIVTKDNLKTCGTKNGVLGHVILPQVFLDFFSQNGENFSEINKSIQTLKSGSGTPVFKDMAAYKALLQTLYALSQENNLSVIQKKILLTKSLSCWTDKKANKAVIIKTLQAIKGIIELNGWKKLSDIASSDQIDFVHDLNEAHAVAFREIIPISHISNFTEKFEKSFGTFRKPNSILIYASSLQKLSESEKGKMMPALASCIENVLNNKFPASRYEGNSHLDIVFNGREDLKELWIKGERCSLDQYLETNKTKQKQIIDFKQILLSSFKEGHVKENSYRQLLDYLKEPNLESSSIIIKGLKEELLETSSKDEQKCILLQLKLIELSQNQNNSLQLIEEAIELLPDVNDPKYAVQFEADIRGLITAIKNLQKKESLFTKWDIKDTDDLCDLLLCGTEIAGSCQNINNNPKLNKCLLGYIQDGKNRLLEITDPNGVIKARAILRLLWAPNEKQPVLFLERIYPRIHQKEYGEALIKFAIDRSKALGLPLTSREVRKNNEKYPDKLVSNESPVPYEYVDAGKGIYPNGKYSILDTHYLF